MTTSSRFLPPHIPGSWHWSGRWLMLDRVVAMQQDLTLLDKLYDTRDCPDCMSSNTMMTRPDGWPFPYSHYCFDCGLVWHHYPARCPLCKGGWQHAGVVARQDTSTRVYGKLVQVPEGMVRCDKCNEVLSVEMVKKCNEEEDFDLGGEL